MNAEFSPKLNKIPPFAGLPANSCKYLHELQKDALKRVYAKKPSDGKNEEYEDDLETDLGDAEIVGDE